MLTIRVSHGNMSIRESKVTRFSRSVLLLFINLRGITWINARNVRKRFTVEKVGRIEAVAGDE